MVDGLFWGHHQVLRHISRHRTLKKLVPLFHYWFHHAAHQRRQLNLILILLPLWNNGAILWHPSPNPYKHYWTETSTHTAQQMQKLGATALLSGMPLRWQVYI